MPPRPRPILRKISGEGATSAGDSTPAGSSTLASSTVAKTLPTPPVSKEKRVRIKLEDDDDPFVVGPAKKMKIAESAELDDPFVVGPFTIAKTAEPRVAGASKDAKKESKSKARTTKHSKGKGPAKKTWKGKGRAVDADMIIDLTVDNEEGSAGNPIEISDTEEDVGDDGVEAWYGFTTLFN